MTVQLTSKDAAYVMIISAVTAMYPQDLEMRSPAEWDNEFSNRMCFIWHARCATAEYPNARAAVGENSRSTAPVYVASFPLPAWVRLASSHTNLILGTEYSYDEHRGDRVGSR